MSVKTFLEYVSFITGLEEGVGLSPEAPAKSKGAVERHRPWETCSGRLRVCQCFNHSGSETYDRAWVTSLIILDIQQAVRKPNRRPKCSIEWGAISR